MESLMIPCPKCEWLNPMLSYKEISEDGIVYNIRCTHCGYHGEFTLRGTYTQTGQAPRG